MPKHALVTGANGFVGMALTKRLASEGWMITAATRKPEHAFANDLIRSVCMGDIDGTTEWDNVLKGVDVVVHLAARVHVMADNAINPLDAYRQVNVKGTNKLAESAARAGIKRFVYLSSVKVNGEERSSAYHEGNEPDPEDAYGISKMEGERQLKSITHNSAMDYVVIRPPLVYGAGVKANFHALMKLVERKFPLPLSGVCNRRSLIYLGNLVDSIITCMTHPAAANQTYLVSDDKDLSTPELIRMIADSLNTPCYLFPFPKLFIKVAGKLLGRGDTVRRLLGSLPVDVSKIKNELNWEPPFSVETGLQHTAKWYKEI